MAFDSTTEDLQEYWGKQSNICLPCQGPDLCLKRWSHKRGSCLSPVGSLPAHGGGYRDKWGMHCCKCSALLSKEREDKARGINNINRKLKAFVLLVYSPLMRFLLFAIMDNLLIVLCSAKSREHSEKAAEFWFVWLCLPNCLRSLQDKLEERLIWICWKFFLKKWWKRTLVGYTGPVLVISLSYKCVF